MGAAHEISKVKREVKVNGELLENAEEDQDELCRKYRSLFREVEEKKERLGRTEAKVEDYDERIEELKGKLSSLQ